MPDIFSEASTAKALEKLDDLPDNEAHAGFVGRDGDFGAEASGRLDLGSKGAFVEADASWMKRAGWGFAAMIGWKKK